MAEARRMPEFRRINVSRVLLLATSPESVRSQSVRHDDKHLSESTLGAKLQSLSQGGNIFALCALVTARLSRARW